MVGCFAGVLMSPPNSLKLCQIIRPHQTSQAKADHEKSFQRHLQLSRIPSSLRLAVVKVHVTEVKTSANPWNAAARSAIFGGRWHWGRGRRGRRSRRRRTFHPPRRTIRMRGPRGWCLRAPFRSGTADSSDWPRESGRDVLKLQVNH